MANLIRHCAMSMTDGHRDREAYKETVGQLTQFGRSLLVHAAQLDGFIEALEQLDDAEHELRGVVKVPDSELED